MTPTDPSPTSRSGLATAHRLVVLSLPLIVLVQAVLAGQWLFEANDVIGVHGMLGNLTFVLALAGLVLTLVLRKDDGLAFGLAVALAAMTFAQIGLGYVGRDTAAAAAWHIPLGVAIIALAGYQAGTLER